MADIESMSLQIKVPERDKNCLRFLCRPTVDKPVQIYERQRHVFGDRKFEFTSCANLSSPAVQDFTSCANYALK